MNILIYIKNPKLLFLGILRRFAWIFNDEFYVKAYYRLIMGEKLNLENPQTFNEKLQWLKLYDRKPEYTQMVDKVAAKEYVAKIIGEEHIIPTLGIWDKFEDINFDKLPNQFVLKTSHDSGGVVICKDKSKFNIENAKFKLRKHLKKKSFYLTREWPYKHVVPRILAEKYLVDESGVELKDYKIFTFDGVPKLIQVDFCRFKDHKRNVFTVDWEFLNITIKYPNNPDYRILKPNQLDNILKVAAILSKGIPHVRVDFYCFKEKYYFGELTFYHGGGMEKFTPEKWDYTLGNWIELPKS